MTDKEFSVIVIEIDNYYSKEYIIKGWYHYAIQFYKARQNKIWGDVNANAILQLANTKKSLHKLELSAIAFSVLRNEEVFKEFLATLPSYLSALIKDLLYEQALGRQAVQKRIGQDILEPPTSDYGTPAIKKEFALFTHHISSTYYGYSTKFAQIEVETSLPLPLKRLLVHYFPTPAGGTINAVPAPIGAGLVFFTAEESINRELPSLVTYYVQQQIKYSDKGRPGATGMKKLQRTLQLSEFLPDGDFPTIRSMLMAGLIYNYKVNPALVHVHQIIKYLFHQHFLVFPAAPYIFTQLKGFSYFQPSDFDKNAPKNIFQVFSQLPPGDWVTIENLHTYIKVHFIDLLPLSTYNLGDKVYYTDDELESYENKIHINNPNHTALIIRPFVAGAAFLFASFGMLELCYENKKPDGKFGTGWFSEYDCLKAVKLTALGAYVLDLQKDYVAPVSASGNRLSPDTDSLMIRVEGNPELAHVQLASYAQKISDNRYVFSPAIFLKECKTAKDIANKITLFRQSAGVKFPPYWEDHFVRLLNNNKLIKAEKNLSVYRLPAGDKELQRLIVQDDVLKKIVIKAEQYYIMVEKTNELVFRNRLKEAGILLD